GVDDTDSLGSRFGAADLAVQLPLGAAGRVVHQAGFEGYRNEVGIDAADDLGPGEDRLTGGAGEHSAAGIVRWPVDKDPEQDRLAFDARLPEPVEQTGLPGDLAPGDAGGLEAVDLGPQRLGGRWLFRGARWRLGAGKPGAQRQGQSGRHSLHGPSSCRK